MYGIVNRTIEDMVKENFGEQKWNVILRKSGVDIDFFIGTEPYDDEITYKLVTTAAAETGLSVGAVFKAVGEWWFLRTAKEKYRGMTEAGGASLREFLINLPMFHNRVMLIYPKLTPPEFRVTDVTADSLHLHYYSKRPGLSEFVHGLIVGLAGWYKTDTTIELLESREANSDHEVFKVSWK
jgi:hypothetical protein